MEAPYTTILWNPEMRKEKSPKHQSVVLEIEKSVVPVGQSLIPFRAKRELLLKGYRITEIDELDMALASTMMEGDSLQKAKEKSAGKLGTVPRKIMDARGFTFEAEIAFPDSEEMKQMNPGELFEMKRKFIQELDFMARYGGACRRSIEIISEIQKKNGFRL